MTATRRAPIAGYEHVLEPGTSDWTVLLLHGTGGDEHDLVDLGRQLAPDATLLSPRGTVREGGTTNRFFARRGANDIDVPDMLRRTDELVEFLRQATDSYQLEASRIVALGYSNGANLALSTMLRHPGVLHGGALLRPVLYHEPEPLPDLSGTHVLASWGAMDPYSPPDAIARLRGVLEASGATMETYVDPAAGHGLVQGDLRLAARWLDQLLAP